MKSKTQKAQPAAAVPVTSSPRRRDYFFLFAFTVSIGLHSIFFYESLSWPVNRIKNTEKKVEQLYKVKIQQLESQDYASRPNSVQLQEERQRVLQQEVNKMATVAHQSAESQLVGMAPSIDPVAIPIWDEQNNGKGTDDEVLSTDQTAKNLITSDASKKSVEKLDIPEEKKIIKDSVTQKQIALSGRGVNMKARLMANLPEPPMQQDPVVARSITTLLRKDDMGPGGPQFNITEPPIDLPPINQILPSPNLVRTSPGPSSLKDEEQAKQKIKNQFVHLDDLLDVQLYTYHHIGGEGYFKVDIRPKASDDQRLRILPKDVVLALDVSSSMGKRRIEVLKSEIQKLLPRIRQEDRFNIVGFRQNVQKFTRTLSPIDKTVLASASKFIGLLEASGKTDIYASLQPLVQLGTERARPLILLLFSDGRPTVGIINSRNIINDLSRFLGPSTSIFCLGTGDVINRYLLDMLAFRNRGLVAFEQNRNALPEIIQSVYGYVEDPVLMRVTTDFDNVDKNDIFPKKLPDLYLKGNLTVWGRLRGENKIVLRLVGEAFDEHKEMIAELPVPDVDTGTYEIARNWAYHRAYNIVGKMVEEGEKPEYLQQIRDISRTYNIITPYSEEILQK